MAFSTDSQVLDARTQQQPKQSTNWLKLGANLLSGLADSSSSSGTSSGIGFGVDPLTNGIGGGATGYYNPFNFVESMGMGSQQAASSLNPFQTTGGGQGGAGAQGGDYDMTFYSQTTQNAVENSQPKTVYDHYYQTLSNQPPIVQRAFYDALNSVSF